MIKPRRVVAMARKEMLHIIRDPWSLGMAIALPMVMLVLFGYALTLDVDRVPLVVWDQDNTPASRELLAQFGGSRYFTIARHVDSYEAAVRDIDTGAAMLVLVVPADYSARLAQHSGAQVQIIVDASDSNTATIAIGYTDAIIASYGRTLISRQVVARSGAGAGLGEPIELRPRVWFNSALQSRNFIVPGLIAVIMMVIAALLTSLTVAREWERGTMEQLISTPVKPAELVLGKLLPYFAIGMLDMTAAVVMGQWLFGVPLRGSVVLLFVMAGVFLAGALSLGMLISISARSQLVASQMAILLTFIPSYLLSGFMFSIANMPAAVRVLTYLVPARYFIRIIKDIYLKGVGPEIWALEAGLLMAFCLVTVSVACLKFRKRLA